MAGLTESLDPEQVLPAPPLNGRARATNLAPGGVALAEAAVAADAPMMDRSNQTARLPLPLLLLGRNDDNNNNNNSNDNFSGLVQSAGRSGAPDERKGARGLTARDSSYQVLIWPTVQFSSLRRLLASVLLL